MSCSVETRQLARRFGAREALRGIDLRIPSGCVYGLMGPNGAGKTTTIKLLLNLIAPTSGTASVLGVESTHLGAADFARIGYVSEDQQVPRWMTVNEIVAYCRPFYPTWDDAFCARLVRQFRLPPDQPIRTLSRGMRLKAAMLAALSFRPQLLILDEPFGGLDPLVRDEMIEGMLELAGQDGWTILISSHDMNELERLADRVGLLDRGRLLFSEETAALLDRHREVVVAVEEAVRAPGPVPPSWLGVTIGERAVRFVDTAYDEAETVQTIRTLLPGSAGVTATPMSLRSIFVAHARALNAEVPS